MHIKQTAASLITSVPDDEVRDSFQKTGNSLQSIILDGFPELNCHEIIKPYTALYCYLHMEKIRQGRAGDERTAPSSTIPDVLVCRFVQTTIVTGTRKLLLQTSNLLKD
jgi:hypothetical protein